MLISVLCLHFSEVKLWVEYWFKVNMTASGGGHAGGSKHPVKIIANIFISFIGAGVLGLPFAFKEV